MVTGERQQPATYEDIKRTMYQTYAIPTETLDIFFETKVIEATNFLILERKNGKSMKELKDYHLGVPPDGGKRIYRDCVEVMQKAIMKTELLEYGVPNTFGGVPLPSGYIPYPVPTPFQNLGMASMGYPSFTGVGGMPLGTHYDNPFGNQPPLPHFPVVNGNMVSTLGNSHLSDSAEEKGNVLNSYVPIKKCEKIRTGW